MQTPQASPPPVREAHEQACQGNFLETEPTLAALDGSDVATARAWELALRALYWMAAPERVRAPRPGDAAAFSAEGEEARHAAALCAERMVVASVISFDKQGLQDWQAALESLLDAGPCPWATLAHRSARAWIALLEGSLDEAHTLAEQVSALAVEQAAPGPKVDASVVQALAALANGNVDEARKLARRASRMSRSEGLLQQEYLANLVLARVRRHEGRAHLALRILTALSTVVPEPWRAWVEWEMALCGAWVDGWPESARTPLPTLLDVVRRGQGSELPPWIEAVRMHVEGYAGALREAEALIVLVDPTASSGSPETMAWCAGQGVVPPYGLRPVADAEGPAAYVVVRPDAKARRILPIGISIVRENEPCWIPSGGRMGTRNHATMAILAFAAPDGLSMEDLFHQVYGFPFEAARHDAVFRGLVHRVRGELGDAGQLTRGDVYRLEPSKVLLVPDPQSDLPLGERILSHLAAGDGRSTARDVATALKVPLRTVQAALGELVEEGGCEVAREGRRVEYVVEDTTFHEPTLHRLRGSMPSESP